MKISVDTNILVRAVLQDDAKQAEMASKLLREASLIAVSLPCLCKLVWILRRGAPLLLTAQLPPAEWPFVLPDLVSRTRALLGFPLWMPDDALLAALAAKLFDDRQLIVPDAVISHMIGRLERSPAAIRDFVARADALALARKSPVNLSLIRDLLAEGQGDLPFMS